MMPGARRSSTRTLARRATCAILLALAAMAKDADAQTLRLRADAIADTQSPVGLVVLQGQDRVRPWLETEALVWAGDKLGDPADVLVFCLHVRHPKGYTDLRAGRFVLATGAVRPVQIDGADAIARSPWGTSVEGFGGLPVVTAFAPRPYDWVAGGRLSQSIRGKLTLGVSYVEQRTNGDISDEEAGADLAFAPARWFDVAARGSFDLTASEVSEALVSAASTLGPLRLELFGSHRSPSLLVPATSLFSVLGNIPADTGGATLRWVVAPRLEVLGSGAVQSVDHEIGGNGWLRATLKLDERGDGSVGVELRRTAVSTARWTGVRAVASQKLPYHLRASTELELAAPDHAEAGVSAWPWALVALTWAPHPGWEAAGAIEASSTPTYRYSTAALIRLSHALELGLR